MKRASLVALIASVPVLIAAVVWRSTRYTVLSIETKRIESKQEAKLEENEKLIDSISQLASKERINSLAAELGLQKASPERRVRIVAAGRGAQMADPSALDKADLSARKTASGSVSHALPAPENGSSGSGTGDAE